MNGFVSKIYPFLAGICSISLLAANGGENDSVLWIFRLVLSLAVAIIAWFLKQMISEHHQDTKARDDRLAKLDNKVEVQTRITAAHEVMYQFWLEELSHAEHPIDGQRKTDKIHRLIKSLAEQQRE